MTDIERDHLVKARANLWFAADELRAMLSTDNDLLADFVFSLLEPVNKAHDRIKRIVPKAETP
jgi:hypothetical protein